MKNWTVVSLLLVLLSGCAIFHKYGKYNVLEQGGYMEREIGPNRFEVNYQGAKLGGQGVFYRAAELAWEKGCQWFVVEEGQGTTYVLHSNSSAPGMVTGSTSQYDLKIRISKTKPAKAKEDEEIFDAYEILNTTPVPGTDKPYPIAERQAKQ